MSALVPVSLYDRFNRNPLADPPLEGADASQIAAYKDELYRIFLHDSNFLTKPTIKSRAQFFLVLVKPAT